MAFYFFSDINGLNIQADNAFGPAADLTIDNVVYEQFLVTSKHTASTDINAIAVCRGQIFVQEQIGNNQLLNIVLKPLDTPPFNFPKIKYFIYKGLKKSSLVSVNNTDVAAKGENDLIDSIWRSFDKTNQTGAPSKTILGLQTTINALPNSAPLEEVYYSIFPGVQFWNVPAGGTIGTFDKDSIGFEIILDTLFYKPTLELARTAVTYIKAKLLISALQSDFFEHWHDKETILNFIDPCAFFGSFYSSKLTVVIEGQLNKWKSNHLYTNLISKFFNKNKCYIDIRNEFNFSLNYFKNYGISEIDNDTFIKIKTGINVFFSDLNYYDSHWPILIIDDAGFVNNNENYQIITLQLPTGNGDNPLPLIYFSKAYSSNEFEKEYSKKDKFKALNVANNYCDEFSFGLPYIDGNFMSSFVQLKYCKRSSDQILPNPANTQIRRNDVFDCLFTPKMHFDFETSPLVLKIHSEELYVDLRSTKGYDAVFVPGIAFDASQITLFANLLEYNENINKTILLPFELTGEFKTSTEKNLFLDRLATEYQDKVLSDVGDNIVLSLHLQQWNSIVSVTEFEGKYPVFIGLDNIRFEEIEGQTYKVSDIVLKGYRISGGAIGVSNYSTAINLYSLVYDL